MRFLRVGVTLVTRARPFFLDLEAGIRKTAVPLEQDIEIVSAEYDPVVQAGQILRFVREGVDALVVAPTDCPTSGSSDPASDPVAAAIATANRAGIPVVTVDTCTVEGKEVRILAHVSSDNVQGGRLAARLLARELHDRGKVAVLERSNDHERSTFTSIHDRVQGFSDEMSTRPGIQRIKPIRVLGEREAAKEVARELLEQHRDLQGIFATNDELALGALDAVETSRSGKPLQVIVGYDANPAARTRIDKYSRLVGSVIQDPCEMGRVVVYTLQENAAGRPVQSPVILPVHLYERPKTPSAAGAPLQISSGRCSTRGPGGHP